MIGKVVDHVFAFVADPRNDSRWCPKVRSVDHVDGSLTGPGAHYQVLHKPIPLRPPRQMDFYCVAWDPPRQIEWREEDGDDVLQVRYELVDEGALTHFSQHDDVSTNASAPVRAIMRRGIGRDIAVQLRRLKSLLEDPSEPDTTCAA